MIVKWHIISTSATNTSVNAIVMIYIVYIVHKRITFKPKNRFVSGPRGSLNDPSKF